MDSNQFINKIKSIVKEYFNELDLIKATRETLIQSKDYSEIYINNKTKELEGREVVIKDMTMEKVKEIRETFKNEIAEWESPSGEKLQLEDLKLLEGYITLTEKEVQTLGEKHKDNPIMQRALKEYANKQGYYFNAKPNGSEKVKAFNEILELVTRGINNPNEYWGVMIKDDKHFNTLVSKYENALEIEK